MTFYSPGETAQKSGFSLDTLRYYDRIGLLGDIQRNASGRRRFTEHDLGWLGMLRCLRETGMPIAEMQRFAALARTDETIPDRIALLETHNEQVEAQLAKLREQQQHIQAKIRYYRDTLTRTTVNGS